MAKDNTSIKPLFGNVLIQPVEAEQKTASGIILPDTAKKESQVGTIRAVGEGKTTTEGKRIPMLVKPGQKVMYKKWGGNEVKVNNEDWTIVDQDDILAIVD